MERIILKKISDKIYKELTAEQRNSSAADWDYKINPENLASYLSDLEKRVEEMDFKVNTLAVFKEDKADVDLTEHPEGEMYHSQGKECCFHNPCGCVCHKEHPEEKEPTKHINPNSYQGDLYKTPTNANLTQPKEECSHELALGRCINCGKKVQTIMKQENSKLKPQPKPDPYPNSPDCIIPLKVMSKEEFKKEYPQPKEDWMERIDKKFPFGRPKEMQYAPIRRFFIRKYKLLKAYLKMN